MLHQRQLFRLSAITLSLISGFAHAETITTNATSEVVAAENSVMATVKELPSVQVNAGLDGSTRHVNMKKMDESTNTSLKEVLFNEPSINFGGGNGTSQFLYIRGMGQNSIDVKVDNAYTDSQIHYHQGRHMLDPALVKVLSVQKGAGSASAGIGQTNGAIVAKTLDAADLLKNSSNPNFGARVNAGYNSNKGHDYGLALFGQHEMVDFLVAGNRVHQGNYKGGKGYWDEANQTDRITYGKLDNTSYLAKIGLNLNNHRLALSHMHQQQKGTRLVREEFGYFGAKQAPAERKMSIDQTNLEWSAKDLGFAQKVEANVYNMVYSRWSADDKGNGYAGGARNVGETKTKINTWGANVNFDSAVHDKVLLKYGLNYRQQKIKPNQLFGEKLVHQQKQDVGVYVEAISDIADKFTLTTGLRYDYFNFKAMDGKERSNGELNPSVGLIFQATPELSFKAHHNYATRSPRMHDAIMAHGARGIVTIGNSTKAEQARNTEISFNYDRGNFGVEGAYFWQNIKDALGTDKGRDNHGNDGAQIIINAGKIKNRGYELGAYYRYEGLTARVGVADSQPKFYGSSLSSNPEYASAIGRTWTASLAYRFNRPNLELAVHHRSVERVKAEDNFFVRNDNGVPQYGRSGSQGKAGYGITDISANWKPLNNDKMNVNFAVLNVGNKRYIPHGQRSDLPGEGRQFRLGVNYTF
ncbi:TonB-dependent receptor domain-containing protein [Neisseriaceae bacterium B1]